MRFWQWIVLLFVACVVLASVLFYVKTSDAIVPLTIQGDISKMVLTVSGQSTHMVKVDGIWHLDPPQNIPLDQEVISDILITAASLKSRRGLAATSEDLKRFELQTSMNMLFLDSDTDSLHMVYGRKTFDGADVYVRELGRTDVFLVSTERIQQLLRPLSALRDPYLFAVPSSEVLDQITVSLPNKAPITMVRHGLFWLQEDVQKKKLHLVNRAQIDRLVAALGSLRVQHFVSIPSLKYGQALSTVTFRYGAVQREMSFFQVSGLLFAALDSYPEEVFQISSEFEKKLSDNWIADQPFSMDRFAIDSVLIDASSHVSDTAAIREYTKVNSGAWTDGSADETLWVHNFFVYLSALVRSHSHKTFPVDGPEYAIFLRVGSLQSRLDIASTTGRDGDNPILRIRFMDRAMWVVDPDGQFSHHVFGEK